MKRSMSCIALILFLRVALAYAFAGFFPRFVELGSLFASLLPLLVLITPFGKGCTQSTEIGFSPKSTFSFLPLFPFFLAGVLIISVITSSVSAAVGYEIVEVNPSGNIFSALIFDALVPSVCEELLCRYVLLRLLSPFGRGGSALLSAILFSLLHANLYQMPYAFFAGLMLATLTLASKSAFIPILFHLLNNLTSIALFYLPDSAVLYFFAATILLLPISFFIALKKGSLKSCTEVLSDGSAYPMLKASLSSPLIFFALLMLLLTV
ncbi:MAG: CPBP family intramembrane metalloprotease [Ruminococcaceae bacterium]|nr:CPBP family intramembrane metalloprotease [Oscillospiraceae bacterium]